MVTVLETVSCLGSIGNEASAAVASSDAGRGTSTLAGTDATEGSLLVRLTDVPAAGRNGSNSSRPKTALFAFVPPGALEWLATVSPLSVITSIPNAVIRGAVCCTTNERTADHADSTGSVGDLSPCSERTRQYFVPVVKLGAVHCDSGIPRTHHSTPVHSAALACANAGSEPIWNS